MIDSVDLLPTILDLCGMAAPEHVQGRSFAPLIAAGGAYTARRFVVAENVMPEVITTGDKGYFVASGKGVGGIRHPDAKMLRMERWKLNYYPGHGGELFDLRNDSLEFDNLYTDPARQRTLQEVEAELLDWLITAGENGQITRRWLL